MELEEIEEEILEDALDSSQFNMKDISEEIIEVDDDDPDSSKSDSYHEIWGIGETGKISVRPPNASVRCWEGKRIFSL